MCSTTVLYIIIVAMTLQPLHSNSSKHTHTMSCSLLIYNTHPLYSMYRLSLITSCCFFFTHIHAHTDACTHAHTDACTHAHLHAHMHTHDMRLNLTCQKASCQSTYRVSLSHPPTSSYCVLRWRGCGSVSRPTTYSIVGAHCTHDTVKELSSHAWGCEGMPTTLTV